MGCLGQVMGYGDSTKNGRFVAAETGHQQQQRISPTKHTERNSKKGKFACQK